MRMSSMCEMPRPQAGPAEAVKPVRPVEMKQFALLGADALEGDIEFRPVLHEFYAEAVVQVEHDVPIKQLDGP